MAESTQTLIVKLHFGTDIRRFTVNAARIDSELTWSLLSERISRSFDLNEKRKIKVTYVDDEKDVITISSNEELAEAVALARMSEPSVLRLTIFKKQHDKSDKGGEAKPAAEKESEAAPAPALPDGLPAELAPFLDSLVKQLPVAMANLPENLKQMLPHAELDLAATLAANTPAGRQADAFCPAEPHGASGTVGVHEGVTCDKSGMCPIVGDRYHLVGHNYDLCEAEFLKLNDKEQALFRKVPPPQPASNGPSAAAPANNVHDGVTCDRSGQSPIVGMRYHLRGHNYDLCQNEYDKLPEAEKALYTAIPPPPAGGRWRPGPWGWRGGGGGCGKWGGMGAAHGHGHGGHGHGHGGEPKLAARFVRDVTIFDGTQMAPGTTFTKIWRLKNVGEVAWPPGTRMLFVGGDQMTAEMSVPLSRANAVLPGEEVDVAVEMTAPKEHGRYLGYWRLTGPHMRRKFGQRVWCHVQVVDPSQSGAEAFDDLQTTLAEIERKKSDLADDDGEAEPVDDELEMAKAMSLKTADAASQAEAVDVADAAVQPFASCTSAESSASSAPAPAPATLGAAAGMDFSAPTKLRYSKKAELTAAPVKSAPAEGPHTGSKDDSKDDSASDDGVLVAADGEPMDAAASAPAAAEVLNVVAVEAPTKPRLAKPADETPAVTTVQGPSGGVDAVRVELASMGFTDVEMIDAVIEKNGADVEASARDLAAATEWVNLLDDLAEMGFGNRTLNTTLMLKNGGNMKRTVRDLVEA